VNGRGRAELRRAVERHRTQRGWSREDVHKHGGPSAGTVKNVERTNRDVREVTLAGLDHAFGWPTDTARSILVEEAKVPALPGRRPVGVAGGLPRRLLAELDGRELLEVRALDLNVDGTKIVITLTGEGDPDLDAIRAALTQIDDLERMLRKTL
jgi:hypothetical protein